MKHRLLHQFTNEEMENAFEHADSLHTGFLRIEDIKIAVAYLNLHLLSRQISESDFTQMLLDFLRIDFISNLVITTEYVTKHDNIDFAAFNTIVNNLRRREVITLQKLSTSRQTYSTNNKIA